jgi:hypothetical protein
MTAPAAPTPPGAPDPHGVKGMFHDASTLASTGLIAAVLFAVVAGIINVFGDAPRWQDHLIALTDTVDVGDVALLGIAVALLLLTPDPPGGIERSTLLRADSVLAGIIAIFGVIRALVLIADEGAAAFRFAGFLATVGVALAAATVSFYSATESFLKQKGQI